MFNAKPARLLRKACCVEGCRGDDATWWDRLPVHTLTFTNPGGPGAPPMDVRIDCGDVVKIIVPGVKPKSYSMSRQGDGEWDVTYKWYPGGPCSGYLESLKIGDEISCFSRGAKRRNAGARVGVVAFGVGITEALPVVAAELAKPEAARVTLVWATRTWADTFWLEKVEALRAAHPTFEVVHVLSRDVREGCRRGRVDAALLGEVFDRAWSADRADCRFLSVGTKSMMRDFDAMVLSLGYAYPANQLLVK